MVARPRRRSAHAADVRDAAEVERFASIVRERDEVVLLLETEAAGQRIDDIVTVDGVAEVHVGINDLALSVGARTRFEPLVHGLLDHVSDCVRRAGLRFGIGGIARIDDETLPIPPDLIYAQYVRLGATAALVSRVFVRPDDAAALTQDIARSRQRLAWWQAVDQARLLDAERAFRQAIVRCNSWFSRVVRELGLREMGFLAGIVSWRMMRTSSPRK
jgi:hypothetical protein